MPREKWLYSSCSSALSSEEGEAVESQRKIGLGTLGTGQWCCEIGSGVEKNHGNRAEPGNLD